MATTPQLDEQGVFVSRPLPRSRAWLALIFLGAGMLSIGGVIEFATGSPMITGQGASSYFSMLFAFHAVAFCGAALLGAFPALAVRPVKMAWLGLVVAAYAGAFLVWRSHPNSGAMAQWIERMPPYLPAIAPLLAGILWRNNAVLEEDTGGSVPPSPE